MKQEIKMLNLKKNNFLGEELSEKEKSFNFSKFHILPIPLENLPLKETICLLELIFFMNISSCKDKKAIIDSILCNK